MKEIALFPLNIVAFPGEAVNLHIFEPRYTHMVAILTENVNMPDNVAMRFIQEIGSE